MKKTLRNKVLMVLEENKLPEDNNLESFIKYFVVREYLTQSNNLPKINLQLNNLATITPHLNEEGKKSVITALMCIKCFNEKLSFKIPKPISYSIILDSVKYNINFGFIYQKSNFNLLDGIYNELDSLEDKKFKKIVDCAYESIQFSSENFKNKEKYQNPKFNPNAKDEDGKTAFYIACEKGDKEIVESLLKHKDTDVNAEDRLGETALYVACHKDNKEIAELLLKHKNIDVNAENQWRRTALYVACYKGNKEVVELLLKHKDIDVNAENYWGRTALYAARENVERQKNNKEIAELLLSKQTIFQKCIRNGIHYGSYIVTTALPVVFPFTLIVATDVVLNIIRPIVLSSITGYGYSNFTYLISTTGYGYLNQTSQFNFNNTYYDMMKSFCITQALRFGVAVLESASPFVQNLTQSAFTRAFESLNSISPVIKYATCTLGVALLVKDVVDSCMGRSA